MHSEFYLTDLLEIEALFLMQQEIAANKKKKKNEAWTNWQSNQYFYLLRLISIHKFQVYVCKYT